MSLKPSVRPEYDRHMGVIIIYIAAAAAIDPVKTKNNGPKYYYTDINFDHLLYQCQN